MQDYFINRKTLLIIPINGYQSKVIEQFNTFIIDKLPTKIVNESCLYYGSSLEGRMKSSRSLLGIKCKCPIIISEIKQIIMYPTTSYVSNDCIWINFDAIQNYYKDENGCINVILINKQVYNLKISSTIFYNQYFKSSRLKGILKNKNR